jgi:hypothetical protein
MKKGIIHNDINSNNFYVKKTKKEILTIDINDMSYNIKLVCYYLVIADFGYSKSIELIPFNKNPNREALSILSQIYNPLNDIVDFIKLFKNKLLNYEVHNIKINNYFLSMEDEDYNLRNSYKIMIKSYIGNNNLEDNIKLFKKSFNDYMYKYIFSKFET